jgi:hypothetical protein
VSPELSGIAVPGIAILDAGKVVNLMLGELNKLYPSFKPRI